MVRELLGSHSTTPTGEGTRSTAGSVASASDRRHNKVGTSDASATRESRSSIGPSNFAAHAAALRAAVVSEATGRDENTPSSVLEGGSRVVDGDETQGPAQSSGARIIRPAARGSRESLHSGGLSGNLDGLLHPGVGPAAHSIGNTSTGGAGEGPTISSR